VKLRYGALRRILWQAINEVAPGRPYIRNAMAPETANREQLKNIGEDPDEDELPEHLRDVTVNPKDCYGPVPPTGEEPYVTMDPYVRGASPLPTPRR